MELLPNKINQIKAERCHSCIKPAKVASAYAEQKQGWGFLVRGMEKGIFWSGSVLPCLHVLAVLPFNFRLQQTLSSCLPYSSAALSSLPAPATWKAGSFFPNLASSMRSIRIFFLTLLPGWEDASPPWQKLCKSQVVVVITIICLPPPNL